MHVSEDFMENLMQCLKDAYKKLLVVLTPWIHLASLYNRIGATEKS